jgi:transposase
VRELRELTRYRQELAGLRTSCRDQVHAVLAKIGVPVTCSACPARPGRRGRGGLRLPQPYAGKITSLRHLAGELTTEITMLPEVTAGLLADDRGYRVIRQLPGIGPVPAAVDGTGDVTRFPPAPQLRSRAGLTPRHRESGIKVVRGHITRQGPPILRRAVIEAVQRVPRDPATGAAKAAITGRRGTQARNIAKVAAARRLLTLISCGLRDGQIRCLSRPCGQQTESQPDDQLPWPAARREAAEVPAPPLPAARACP